MRETRGGGAMKIGLWHFLRPSPWSEVGRGEGVVGWWLGRGKDMRRGHIMLLEHLVPVPHVQRILHRLCDWIRRDPFVHVSRLAIRKRSITFMWQPVPHSPTNFGRLGSKKCPTSLALYDLCPLSHGTELRPPGRPGSKNCRTSLALDGLSRSIPDGARPRTRGRSSYRTNHH